MLSITWIDFLLRLLPESLIIILVGYAVSKKEMNRKLYLISSILLAVLTYGYRILPISTILPMILSAITVVMILIYINKIKTIHAIIATFICLVVSVISEGLNILVLENVYNIETKIVFQNSSPIVKYLYGLPSLLLFGLIFISYYFIVKNKKAKKNVDIK